MDFDDRFCVLSYDEMVITRKKDYNKFKGSFVGKVTLGKNEILGSKLFLVLARGLKNPWKQIIAYHVSPSKSINQTLLKNFIEQCIEAVEKCGLYVVALSSDLDTLNRALWSSFGINVNKFGQR